MDSDVKNCVYDWVFLQKVYVLVNCHSSTSHETMVKVREVFCLTPVYPGFSVICILYFLQIEINNHSMKNKREREKRKMTVTCLRQIEMSVKSGKKKRRDILNLTFSFD